MLWVSRMYVACSIERHRSILRPHDHSTPLRSQHDQRSSPAAVVESGRCSSRGATRILAAASYQTIDKEISA